MPEETARPTWRIVLSYIKKKVSLTLAHISNAKIPELSKPSVSMRDPQRVQEILQSMVKAGSNTVQVTIQCLYV